MTVAFPDQAAIPSDSGAKPLARDIRRPGRYAGAAPELRQLGSVNAILFALRWQVVGLVAMACQVVLVRDAGALSFPLILGFLAIVTACSRLAGLIVYAQILFYQNVLISVFSPGMTQSDLTVLSGTSFAAVLVLAAGPAYQALKSGMPVPASGRDANRAAVAVLAAVAVAVAYTVLGIAVAGATPAAVGFRNATAMLLAIVAGLSIGERWHYRTVAVCLAVCLLPGIIISIMEVSDPAWYLTLINGTTFNNLKSGDSPKPFAYTAADVIDNLTQLPFNSALFESLVPGRAYRFGGPNMHSISYGYVLAAAELMLASLGWWILVPPLLVMTLMVGVKGAAILSLASIVLYGVWSLTRRLWVLVAAGIAFCAAYVTFGILSGIQTGDFHVVGFLGGVNGFLRNPMGHGIGVGGNLSVGILSMQQWQELQHEGADVGLESAVGVLLYQMGLGCIAIAAALGMLVRAIPFGGRGGARGTDILVIGLFLGLVNGVFQEEAYSPYGTGLLCLLCGILAANGRRGFGGLRWQ